MSRRPPSSTLFPSRTPSRSRAEPAPRAVDRRDIRGSIRPGLFLRELLCLDAALLPVAAPGCDFDRRGPLEVSGYAHHPYSIVYAPDVGGAHDDDITFADRDRLAALLDAAAEGGRLPRDLPMWWTEYGWQTNPPDPIRGVSLEDHARWLGQAERMAWEDSRVAAITQFLLRDDEPRAGAPAGSPRYWGTYQSGLEFADGRPKPAYGAYRLPFTAPAAVSVGAPVALWGRVRPARPGDVIEVQVEFAPDGGDWSSVGSRTRVRDARGVFEETVTASRSGSYRFRWLAPRDLPQLASLAAQPEGEAYTSAAVPVVVASSG